MSQASASTSLEQRITDVGTVLRDSFRAVLSALPGAPHRPSELSRTLRLNRDIASRIVNATQAEHPYAATHAMPGPEPLRRLIKAARRKDIDADLLEQAEASVRRFEQLIRHDAGDRDALDALLGMHLPDVRARFELAAKQTLFKGASLIKGAFAEVWLHTAMVHPSTDSPNHHDVAYVFGTLGLRRLQPDAVVKFTYQQFGVPEPPPEFLGGGADHPGDALDRFCVLPPAIIDRQLMHRPTAADTAGVVYALGGDAVGPGSATDKLLAEIRRSAIGRFAADTPRNRKSLFVAPSVPVKLLIFDVMLHDDVNHAMEPELILYDTTVDGMASVNDPMRDVDRLKLDERVEYLGRGTAGLPLPELVTYPDMIGHVCTTLDWNPEAFRTYRTRMQYPPHGTQLTLAYNAPPRSSTDT